MIAAKRILWNANFDNTNLLPSKFENPVPKYKLFLGASNRKILFHRPTLKFKNMKKMSFRKIDFSGPFFVNRDFVGFGEA